MLGIRVVRFFPATAKPADEFRFFHRRRYRASANYTSNQYWL
jgi:hypothetical protein